MIFIDFKQAYNSIDREKLCIALKNFELHKELVNLVIATIRNLHATYFF